MRTIKEILASGEQIDKYNILLKDGTHVEGFLVQERIDKEHDNEWIYSNSISNVRIFTKSGKMKRIRLLKESIREDKALRINNGSSLIQVKKKGE